MKKISKLVIVLFSLVLIVTACGKKNETESMKVAAILEAKELNKKMVNTPIKFGIGEVDAVSVLDFYEKNAQKWSEMLENGSVPVQYEAGVSAQKDTTIFLVDSLKNEDVKNIAYVGDSDNGEVSGLFIYYFSEPIVFPGDQITKSNELTKSTKAGEYYFVKGNYFIAFEHSFVKDVDELFVILEEAITEATV